MLETCSRARVGKAWFVYGARIVVARLRAISGAVGSNSVWMTGIYWAGRTRQDTARWRWLTARNADDFMFTAMVILVTPRALILAPTDVSWLPERLIKCVFGMLCPARKSARSHCGNVTRTFLLQMAKA